MNRQALFPWARYVCLMPLASEMDDKNTLSPRLQQTEASAPTSEAVELQKVLESRTFARSPRMVRLLTYICGKAFAGETDQLKEYTIAVELFGRPAGFEPHDDASIRVDMNRLRKQLRKYYRVEGRHDSLVISIPSGQYTPVFSQSESNPTRTDLLSASQDRLQSVGWQSDFAAPRNTRSKHKLSWWYAAVPALILAGLGIGLALRGPGNQSLEPWTFRPLTYSGRADKPALSPDGKQVAFRWSGENYSEWDLYVKLVGGGNPLRLKDTQPLGRPAWSADGSRIAYQRRDGLYVIPALGGTPRRIARLRDTPSVLNVAWAPDGSFFILDGRGAGLIAIRGEGGEPRELTKPQSASDHYPAIAPDGSAVAFVRRTSMFNSMLMLLPLTAEGIPDGEPQSITRADWYISTLDWTSDAQELLFESAPGGANAALWRVSRTGGDPVRVNSPSTVAAEPTTARESGRVVFSSAYYETKIIRLPITDGKSGAPRPIITALGEHRDFSVSPDGSRLAFISTRTGSKEIWIAGADGSNQTQLTFFEGASIGSPRWSPDATRFAFDGCASGSSDLYLVTIEGGKPVRLTTDPGNEFRPSWSHDGEWIYFGWNRGGGANEQIWKMPAKGGNPVQVTRRGGHEAFETPDGRWLFVVQAPNLYRIRLDSGGETQIRANMYPNLFNLGGRHVYVIDESAGQILRSDFETIDFEPVFTFDKTNRPNCFRPCLALPRDESYAIYPQNPSMTRTLILIENFH